MSDIFSQKISELQSSTGPSENAYFPLSEANSDFSEKVSVATLRETIGFENAFPNVAIALLSTKESDVFFVYEDDKKENVLGYVNQGNGNYSALMTDSNVQLRYATSSFIVNSLFFLRGAESFEELRTIKPWYEGQRIKLKSYYVDGLTGGGEFVARLAVGVDDSGVIAAGEGYYWERQLTDPVLRPEMFGGIGGSSTTDNTNAILACVAAAKAGRSQIDFRGGPWRVTRTVDLTGIFGVRTDVSGRFLVDPDNFTAAHNANYAVVFGNPDTSYGLNRATNCSVIGIFQVVSDNRNTPLNGVYIKGALMTFNSMRAVNFNGSGVYLSACWDSKFDSISVENCGNITSFAFQISAGGDTSNCLFIGRIQAETSFHKQISINVIRSEIHTIHAERMYILTTDDGTTSLPSGLNYLNTAILMSNSILGQVVIDALDSAANNTVTTTPSVSLNLYSSKATSLQMVSSMVVSTYGLYGTIENSSFLGYYNIANPIVMDNCKISNANGTGVLKIIKGEIRNCTIDTITPHYGTDGLLISNSTINNDIDITAVPVKNIVFRNCNIIGTVKRTDSPASNGYAPTTFIDCRIGTVAGYWQHRCTIIGGYVTNVNLVDRAYVEFINVAGGTFNCGAQIGFITFNCNFNTVTKWAPCALGVWPIGKVTQRLGGGDASEYVNTVAGASTFITSSSVRSSSFSSTTALNTYLSTGGKNLVVDSDLTNTATLVIPSNTKLSFAPGITLNADSTAKEGISIKGVAPSSFVNLVTNGLAKDVSITLANSSFNVGDWLEIRSEKVLPGPNNYQVKQSVLRKITAKTTSGSNTIYRLHTGLLFDFNTADTAKAGKATVLENIVIDGANLNKDGFTNTFALGINCAYVYNLTLKNITIRGTKDKSSLDDVAGRSAVKLFNCSNVTVDNLTVDSIGWYGVEIIGCSENVDVNKLYSTDSRHAVSFNWLATGDLYGGPLFSQIRNSVSHNARLSGFDTHDLGLGLSFENCQSFSSGDDGFQIRAINATLINCYAFGATLDGFGGAIGATNTKLIGCKAENNTRYGVNFGYEGGILENCHVINNGFIGVAINSGKVSGGSITGNNNVAIDLAAGFNPVYGDLKIENVLMPAGGNQTKVIRFKGDAGILNQPELVTIENCNMIGYGRDWATLTGYTTQPMSVITHGNRLSPNSTEGSKVSGIATLVSGTVTINTTEVFSQLSTSANVMRYTSQIVLRPLTFATNVNSLYVSAISNGVSFTVKSNNAADGSAFCWEILL